MIRRDEASAPNTAASVLRQGEDVAGDEQLLRIARIGKCLFRVANCVVTLGIVPQATDGEGSIEMAELAFCQSLPATAEALTVHDLAVHPLFQDHAAVSGAPHIRFIASHPVFGQDRQPAGRVSLVDYAPRATFLESDRQLLADIAVLVERELQLRTMDALHLELQKKNKNLRRKSLIDPLIGTWNRGAIMRILGIEADRCEKAGLPLSLIVADLDYFKKINDSHGHPAGDTVLVKVASRLRSCIRPQEALGRYGGEEFLIVLPGSSHATAMAVAERMRSAIAEQPESIGGVTMSLTISAGVASTELFTAATAEELISHADKALYAAKDAGRNRVMAALPNLS